MELKPMNLRMQEYFLPTKQEISKEDAQCIKVKMNIWFKWMPSVLKRGRNTETYLPMW